MPARGGYAKGAARRAEILDAAVAVLAERGFHGASVRAIGDAAGLDAAHILYYFGSREELLLRVVERWDAQSAAVDATAGPDAAPRDPLDALVAAVRRNVAIPGLLSVYFALAAEAAREDHLAHDYFRQRFDGLARLLTSAIEREQEAGAIPADRDADAEARKLIALADGLQLQWLLDGRSDAGRALEAAVAGLRSSGVTNL